MKLLNTPLLVSRSSRKHTPSPCEGAVHYMHPNAVHGNLWTITFATLEELEKFIETHGEVVITAPDPQSLSPSKKELGSIEIYDDYRE